MTIKKEKERETVDEKDLKSEILRLKKKKRKGVNKVAINREVDKLPGF